MDSSTSLRPSGQVAVHRHLLAGPHQDQFTGLTARIGTTDLVAVAQDRWRPWVGDRAGVGWRPPPRAWRSALQEAPDQDHEQEVDHRVPVDLADPGPADGDIEGIEIGDGDADGDGQVHGEVPGAQARSRPPYRRDSRSRGGWGWRWRNRSSGRGRGTRLGPPRCRGRWRSTSGSSWRSRRRPCDRGARRSGALQGTLGGPPGRKGRRRSPCPPAAAGCGRA